MTTQALSLPQANLKMALWQVDADSMSSSDLYVWLNDSGLPYEVTIRLHELATGAIAGHRLDKRAQGKEVSGGIIGIAEDILGIARSFFQLLIDVFNAVFRNVITA